MMPTSEPLSLARADASRHRRRSSHLQRLVNRIRERLISWVGPPSDPDIEAKIRRDADFDADDWLRKHDVDAWYRIHTGRDLQAETRRDLGRLFAWLALASLVGFAVTRDGRWIAGGAVFIVDRVLTTWWPDS